MEIQMPPLPQADAPIAQPSTIVPHRNNPVKVILIIILVLLLICSLVVNFLQYADIPALVGNKSPRLPINPKNPYVVDYSVTYYIKTKITAVKKTPQGLELSTNINDNEAPKKFYVNSKTLVSVSADGIKDKAKPSAMDQLKVGQTIQLWTYRNTKTAEWVTFRIVFTPPE